MPNIIYSLENAINRFFSEGGASSSKIQCDEFVSRTYGGQVRPVDIQGSNSYTVIAGSSGNKIVQFREQAAKLDIDMLALAKDVHGDIVPSCSELGHIGDPNGSQLAIYEMERLPGANYITVRPSLMRDQQLNTINSLASFFAQAWQRGMPAESPLADRSIIRAQCYSRFNHLADALPKRFAPAVAETQVALPALFDESYPLVLTHGDLNEMNMLVNPSSGEITGIIDWPNASILPFGFTLYALENVLGSMGSGGWKWFDNAEDLRNSFWRAFRGQTGLSESQTRLAELAGKAGILMRYGTAYDSGFPGMIGTRDPKSENFRYLDALLLQDTIHS